MTADSFSVERVSAARLVRLLEEAHWIRTGGREGLYVRYAPPEAADLAGERSLSESHGESAGAIGTLSIRRTIVVPLDPSAPDYREMLGDAVDALRRVPSPIRC